MDPIILMMGLNHTTAPVQIREQIASATCNRDESLNYLQTTVQNVLISEHVILSTCNRTEVYVVTADPNATTVRLRALFDGNETLSTAAGGLYSRTGREAVEHLFAVACGLDSMILGEVEILGQVRNAYQKAAQAQMVGPVLHYLFNRAIHTGKRAHSETEIGAGAISVAYAAVALARHELGMLKGRRILIIGAGDTARRAARSLVEDRVSTVMVANRTYDHAVELAGEIDGCAVHFDGLPRALAEADLVISATAAPHQILSASMIREAMAGRASRPLCLIDLAVPRDIDAAAGQIENVRLFNLDDLQRTIQANRAARGRAVAQVSAIVEQETESYWQWFAERRAAPVIADLRERAEAIRSAELDKALRRLGHLNLSERDRSIIAALSSGILNRFLAAPTEHLKARVQSGDGQVYLDAVCELFELADINEQQQLPPAV